MATTYKARTPKTVNLGSGHTYIFEFDGEMPTAEALVQMCKPEARFGTTKNGATFNYTVTKHEESDDFGFVRARKMTKEDGKLKLGVFSWYPGMLDKLVSTFRSAEDGDYMVVKIGGIENDDGKQWLVVFEFVDKVHGPMYLCIVGTNETGLTFSFSPDNVTKLEPEFAADPQDDVGTIATIIYHKSAATAPAQNAEQQSAEHLDAEQQNEGDGV